MSLFLNGSRDELFSNDEAINSFIHAIRVHARLSGYPLPASQIEAAWRNVRLSHRSDIDAALQTLKELKGSDQFFFKNADNFELPRISRLRNGRWVVIVGANPGEGWRFAEGDTVGVLSDADLSGQSLSVKWPAKTQAAAGSAERGSSILSQMARALLTSKGLVLELVLSTAFVTLLALSASLFSMQVYDRVIPARSQSTLIVLLSGVLLVLVLDIALRYIRGLLVEHAVTHSEEKVNSVIHDALVSTQMVHLPKDTGMIVSQIRSFDSVKALFSAQNMASVIEVPISLGLLLVIAALTSVHMAMIPLVAAVVGIALAIRLNSRNTQISKEAIGVTNQKMTHLVSVVDLIETVKSTPGAWRWKSSWSSVTREARNLELKMRRGTDNLVLSNSALYQISYLAVVSFGAIAVMQGEMTMGALIAASILSSRIMSPLMTMPNVIVQYGQAKASSDALTTMMSLPKDNKEGTRPLHFEDLHGDLLLEKVGFRFGEGTAGIEVENLRFKAGEKVAIVGPVGSGKSTLLKVLAGLYQPDKGAVFWGGHDMRHIDRESVVNALGYVSQDVRVFPATIRENLTLGIDNITDHRISEVIKTTGFDGVIRSHPEGMERTVGGHSPGLSGGQRQLLAISRVLLRSPNLLLLDEPTSAMDQESERKCLMALRNLSDTGSTMILVTHKWSLLDLVDRVIVLVNGRVALDGPRDDILQKLNPKPPTQVKQVKVGITKASDKP